jgi:hypothetical protein
MYIKNRIVAFALAAALTAGLVGTGVVRAAGVKDCVQVDSWCFRNVTIPILITVAADLLKDAVKATGRYAWNAVREGIAETYGELTDEPTDAELRDGIATACTLYRWTWGYNWRSWFGKKTREDRLCDQYLQWYWEREHMA